VSKIQKIAEKLVQKIAKKVSKNHLFEQDGERLKQESLQIEKDADSQAKKELVIPASNALIEEHLLQVRVVNYWATWCAPCVEELPLLAELEQEIGVEKILGVSWDLFQGGELAKVCTDIEKVKEKFGIHYSSMLVVEPPEQFFEYFEVNPQTVPQTIVFSESFEKIFHCKEKLTKEDIQTITSLLQKEAK
jgi:thiol-disulfide isomerase/thioredoxin